MSLHGWAPTSGAQVKWPATTTSDEGQSSG
jgi:hypothetical protein